MEAAQARQAGGTSRRHKARRRVVRERAMDDQLEGRGKPASKSSAGEKEGRSGAERSGEERRGEKMPFFEVHVAKEKFKFNCAHFIAFKGFRERLHGHNYQVGVRLSGDRGPDGYVLDFGEVKEQVMRICKLWNERFICPVKSDVLDIDLTSNEDNITINCEDGTHFSFPRDDCLFLPIVHSSAEELAEHFAVTLVSSVGAERLRSRGIRDIEVSVAEAPHQAAIFRCTIEHLLEIANGLAEATQTQVERPTPKPCTHTNCCKTAASDAQKQEQEHA